MPGDASSLHPTRWALLDTLDDPGLREAGVLTELDAAGELVYRRILTGEVLGAEQLRQRARATRRANSSATISFGQALDPDVLDRSRAAAQSCSPPLAAGSSLTVQPTAGLVGLAASVGATVVVCTSSETRMST